jgi:hypothetical protein
MLSMPLSTSSLNFNLSRTSPSREALDGLISAVPPVYDKQAVDTCARYNQAPEQTLSDLRFTELAPRCA